VSGLVPLSVVTGELGLLAGQAEELAAEAGAAIVAGWHQVPSVSAGDADRMAAEMAARRERAGAQLEAALAGAPGQAASGSVYAMTDRPGMPALQHEPWSGRLA
jgi:hypothetical protein